MATLAPQIQQKFTDDNGNPLVGGKIYTYEAGTTTPLATYDSYSGSANANPIILDANGECDMWLGSRAYKIEIKDSSDVLLKTIDNVVTSITSSSASSDLIENLGVTTSVGSSALTINLTDSLGNSPSSASPVVVGFRSSTLSSGLSSRVLVESALSLVVPSGATLGHSDAVNKYIFVYLINNSGVAEIAVSSKYFVERAVVSTTAIGTGSDSSTGLYSTTARTGVSIRLIARLKSNQTTAGTWAALPTEIQTGLEAIRSAKVKFSVYANSGSIANNSTTTPVSYAGVVHDDYGMRDGDNAWYMPWDGSGTVHAILMMAAFDPASNFVSSLDVYKNGSLYKTLDYKVHADVGGANYIFGRGSLKIEGLATDQWTIIAYHNTGASRLIEGGGASSYNYLDFEMD